MQAKLTAINEQSLKVQELARDLSYGFASQPDSKILDYQNHAKQLKEAISSYTKELVAADPKIAYAEQRLQELSRIHNLQLEQVKETSAVRTISSLLFAFMPFPVLSKFSRATWSRDISESLAITRGQAC